jgi:hypothetical protein
MDPPRETLSSITGVNLSKSLSDVLSQLHPILSGSNLSSVLAAPTPPRASTFRPRVESTESGATSSTATSPFTNGAIGSLLSSPVTDAVTSTNFQPQSQSVGVAQGHARRTSSSTHPLGVGGINSSISPPSVGLQQPNSSLPFVDREAGDVALLGLARFVAQLSSLSSGSSSSSSSDLTLQLSTDDIAVLTQLIEILHASLGYPLINLLAQTQTMTRQQQQQQESAEQLIFRSTQSSIPPVSASVPGGVSTSLHNLPRKFSVLSLSNLNAPLPQSQSGTARVLPFSASSSHGDFTSSRDNITLNQAILQTNTTSDGTHQMKSSSRMDSAVSMSSMGRGGESGDGMMAPLSYASASSTSISSLGGRRPTSRALAAAELLKRYTAYPSVFDANTREFVESIVAPKKFNAAKEKMKSVAAVVGKLAVATNLFRQASQSNVDTATAVISAYRSAHGLDVPASDMLLPRSSSPDIYSSNSPTTGSILTNAHSTEAKDPLTSRNSSAETEILSSMDSWDFNILEANKMLLLKLGNAETASSGQSEVAHSEPMQNIVNTVAPSSASSALGQLSLDLNATSVNGAAQLALQREVVLGKERGFGVGTEMLVATFCSAIERLHLADVFGIDMNIAASFSAKIARGYNTTLSYHNALHGADVAQAVYYTLSKGQLAKNCSSEVQLALLIAAACHDVGYPGVNNAFLIASSHPLALTYNDSSPLENMHVATAFLSMRYAGCNILSSLSSEQRLLVRSLIIAGILGTDNSQHFKLMTKLKRRTARAMRPPSNSSMMASTTRVSDSSRGGGGGSNSSAANEDEDDEEDEEDEDHTVVELFDGDNATNASQQDVVYQPFDMSKSNDARLLVTSVLHACDISNPARPQSIASHWSDWITNEFHNQGDLMKATGLVVPAMHDRNSSASLLNRAQTQAGFITVLVLPLWDVIANTPLFKKVMVCADVYETLDKNLKEYISVINSEKEKLSNISVKN